MNIRRSGLVIDTTDGVQQRRAHSPSTGSTASGTTMSTSTLPSPGNGKGKEDKEWEHETAHANAYPLATPYQPYSNSNTAANETHDSLPAGYLSSILTTQLVLRGVGAAIYLGGVLGWYQYRRYVSITAYWLYWIPFHYAAMNALRRETGRHAAAFALALLSASLEAFVLISLVYNPEVWGASKLRYFVLPTATQGIANLLMTLGACGVVLVRRMRGETRIPLSALTAPALPAADIAFFLSLWMIPYVSFTSDVAYDRVVSATALLNACILPFRHHTFTKAFRRIPHLPDHKLFASITLSDATQKGAELSRKMGVAIPGLPEEEAPRNEEEGSGFMHRVYVVHLLRLVIVLVTWDRMCNKTPLTATVFAHPYIACSAISFLYGYSWKLGRMRQKGVVTFAAVVAADILKGISLASAGGLIRWFAIKTNVEANDAGHLEVHLQLLILITFVLLLGVRGALALTFFTTSPRGRALRGFVTALAVSGSAARYLADRWHPDISLRGLHPWRYREIPSYTAGTVLAVAIAAAAYITLQEVWRANARSAAAARLPDSQVLLGTLILAHGEKAYEDLRVSEPSLPLLSENVFSAV